MIRAVSEEDIEVIFTQLVYLAKQGNVMAAREVLDRCLGTAFDPATIVVSPATGGIVNAAPRSDPHSAIIPLRRSASGVLDVRNELGSVEIRSDRVVPASVVVDIQRAPRKNPSSQGGSPFS